MELIQHGVDRCLLLWTWLEDTDVFEVGKQGKQDLVPHRCDLYLRHHQTQLLDPARSAGAAVANEASRLVVPVDKEKIDRVLERAGNAMVVLGRDEDVGVERADLGGPYFGVRFTVLPQ